MSDDIINVRTVVEKTPDADLLREMIGLARVRLMELEVGGSTGAAYGERARCGLKYDAGHWFGGNETGWRGAVPRSMGKHI